MDRFGDLYRPPDRARYEQHPPSARRRRISSSLATRPDAIWETRHLKNRAAPRGVESKTTEAPKRKWIGFNEPMDGVADLIEFLRHVPTLVAF